MMILAEQKEISGSEDDVGLEMVDMVSMKQHRAVRGERYIAAGRCDLSGW
jgi:hypothetical protein